MAAPSLHRPPPSGGPQYARTRRGILALIAKGQPGDPLPAERHLCQSLGVSRATLRRVIEHLCREDVLEAVHGSGTFIKGPAPSRASVPASTLLALVVPSVEFPAISRLVTGMEARATERGYGTLLAHDHGNPRIQIDQLRRILDMGSTVRGILIYPDAANLSDPAFLALLDRARESKTEIVFVDRFAAIPGVSCVLSDNFRGMYRATEHLIQGGRRRFAFLTFSQEARVSYHDRRRAFYQALADHGIPAEGVREEIVPPDDRYEVLAERTVSRWIAEGHFPGIDAVVGMIGNMAYGAYVALRKAGFRVPEDVALVGYDDHDFRGFPGADLDLTFVDQPGEKIGAECVDLLLRKLRGEESGGRHILIEPGFVIGNSSAPAKAP